MPSLLPDYTPDCFDNSLLNEAQIVTPDGIPIFLMFRLTPLFHRSPESPANHILLSETRPASPIPSIPHPAEAQTLMRASSSSDICATNSAARDGFFSYSIKCYLLFWFLHIKLCGIMFPLLIRQNVNLFLTTPECAPVGHVSSGFVLDNLVNLQSQQSRLVTCLIILVSSSSNPPHSAVSILFPT